MYDFRFLLYWYRYWFIYHLSQFFLNKFIIVFKIFRGTNQIKYGTCLLRYLIRFPFVCLTSRSVIDLYLMCHFELLVRSQTTLMAAFSWKSIIKWIVLFTRSACIWIFSAWVQWLFRIKLILVKLLKYLLLNERIVWFICFNEYLHISLWINTITTLFYFISTFIDSQSKLHHQLWKVCNFDFYKVSIVFVFFLNFVHNRLVIHFKKYYWIIKAFNCDLIIILGYHGLLFSSFNRISNFHTLL